MLLHIAQTIALRLTSKNTSASTIFCILFSAIAQECHWVYNTPTSPDLLSNHFAIPEETFWDGPHICHHWSMRLSLVAPKCVYLILLRTIYHDVLKLYLTWEWLYVPSGILQLKFWSYRHFTYYISTWFISEYVMQLQCYVKTVNI